jgi:hypothetical protein
MATDAAFDKQPGWSALVRELRRHAVRIDDDVRQLAEKELARLPSEAQARREWARSAAANVKQALKELYEDRRRALEALGGPTYKERYLLTSTAAAKLAGVTTGQLAELIQSVAVRTKPRRRPMVLYDPRDVLRIIRGKASEWRSPKPMEAPEHRYGSIIGKPGKKAMMARFGATLKNVRWSWDGVKSDGSIIFIGWMDQATRKADNSIEEYRLAKSMTPTKDKPGERERIRHIQGLVKNNAAGYLVLATAKDVAATPREIASIDGTQHTVRLEVRDAGIYAIPIGKNSAPDALDDDDRTSIEESLAASEQETSATEKQQLINARRGQGLFRSRVELIEPACRLTGVKDRAHLRASHIKPWKFATNAERLDGNNGLLLAPHVDHLFDRGFISFEDDGRVLVSKSVDPSTLKAWALDRLDPTASYGSFNAKQREYLAFHRENRFRSPNG